MSGLGLRAVPVPVREGMLKLCAAGETTAEIAELLGSGGAAVRRVRQQFQARGTLQPQTHLGGRKALLTKRRPTRLHQAGRRPA